MGKPKTPPPPDYAAAAKEQGVANTNSALATDYLNQVNQVGPDGSLTFSYSTPSGGSTGGYDPETGQYTAPGQGNANGGHFLPDGTYIPATTATTTLSPEQQQLHDQNITLGTNLNDLALRGVDYVDQATQNPLKPDNFRGISYAGGDYNTDPGTSGLQYQYDFSNAGKMPSADDFGAQRDQVTQALLDRMQPSLDQDRERLSSSLANQGINLGSQAYSDARFNQDRSTNDARLAAVLAGSQEQQRLFQDAMGIRQQGVGEAMDQGNFNNSARGQAYGQTSNANLQNFNMGLAKNQFNNQALGQDVQMADYFQNQPLNILNALRSGNQVTMPQFQNWSTGAQVAAAPIYAATNDKYNAQMEAYKAKSGTFGDILGGLGSVGSAAIMASDRRLKKNIVRLFKGRAGLDVYSFNYLSGQPSIGYMADEVVERYPEAVSYDVGGFAMVDYGRVG